MRIYQRVDTPTPTRQQITKACYKHKYKFVQADSATKLTFPEATLVVLSGIVAFFITSIII